MKYEGKNIRLGYYDMEMSKGEKWVKSGDDNFLEETMLDLDKTEPDTPKKKLKTSLKTINNRTKEVTTSLKMNEHSKDKVFFKIICVNYNNYIYIKKCLESVFSQTFNDFFLIVVDDISTDDSPKICEIFKKRYP